MCLVRSKSDMTESLSRGAIVPYELPARPAVTRIRHKSELELLDTPSDAGQEMGGFPERYVDIVDYIVKITHEIWIDGAVGLIYETYDPNCVVYTAGGIGRGVESVVQSTISSM